MFNSFRRSYSFDETLISRREFANQLSPVCALVTAAVNNNINAIDSSKNIINSSNSNLTKLYQDTISSNVPLLTASKSVEDDDDRNKHQRTQLPIESVLCEHKNVSNISNNNY